IRNSPSSSTLRTREYGEKGEAEGKTLLDAVRVGTTEGMQHFDGEIEKLIRSEKAQVHRLRRRECGWLHRTTGGSVDWLDRRAQRRATAWAHAGAAFPRGSWVR